jgi:hypothetical protein
MTTNEVKAQQVIEVENGMAYRWAGSPPLAVGERVLLPGNWRTGHEPFASTVTALDSDYKGYVKSIIGRA